MALPGAHWVLDTGKGSRRLPPPPPAALPLPGHQQKPAGLGPGGGLLSACPILKPMVSLAVGRVSPRSSPGHIAGRTVQSSCVRACVYASAGVCLQEL